MGNINKPFTKREIALTKNLLNIMVRSRNPGDNDFDDDFDGSGDELLLEALKSQKVKIEKTANHGSYRIAFILGELVLKTPKDDDYQGLRDETTFIKRMRKGKFKRHFPLTECFAKDDITIQMQRFVPLIGSRKPHSIMSFVETLGEAIGLDDIHRFNYGWVGIKGKECPVFIDVTDRNDSSRSRPVPSWAIMYG